MRSVVILGSTGSIGENTLRVIADSNDNFRIVGLSTGSNVTRLLEQARKFGVNRIAVADLQAAEEAARLAPSGVNVLSGSSGIADLAGLPEADIVVCALVGLAGLRPVLRALEAGHDVALATKEVLVAAGARVMDLAAERGARVLPIDSEHSALFQCLERIGAPHCVRAGKEKAAADNARQTNDVVRRLVLTASGGPFARCPEIDFDRVSVSDALRHPRWAMGRKVTIDSATMMNKGLEIIEARWLFDISFEHIDVLLHPESIVHGLVEFRDGAVLAHLSPPDMRFAIHYALHWPKCASADLPALDLARIGALHFAPPDERRFPCLALARRAAEAGGTVPAVLNAANEIAVQAFLDGRVPFSGIWALVDKTLAAHDDATGKTPSLAAIENADAWARRHAAGLL